MDIFINPKIIKVDRNRGHNVKYHLYKEDGDGITREVPSQVKTNSNTVCFANLMSELKGLTEVNRIMYLGKDIGKDAVDATERTYWIRLCKDHGFLPEYVEEEWAEDRRYVLRLNDQEMNPSLLYIYLSCFRSMQEDPGFIRAMLYLVPCYRMDFAAGWCLASALSITNSWHNIVQIGRNYGSDIKENVNNVTIPILYAIALKRYMKDPYKYDKRGLRDDNSHPYRVCNTLEDICKIQRNVKAVNLMDENIVNALNSDSDKEAMNYLKHLP